MNYMKRFTILLVTLLIVFVSRAVAQSENSFTLTANAYAIVLASDTGNSALSATHPANDNARPH